MYTCILDPNELRLLGKRFSILCIDFKRLNYQIYFTALLVWEMFVQWAVVFQTSSQQFFETLL